MNGTPLPIETCSIHCARLPCQQLDAPKWILLWWLVQIRWTFTVFQIALEPKTVGQHFFTNFRVTLGLFSKITLTPPFCPSICKSLSQAFFESVQRVFCTVRIVLRGHYVISLSNFGPVTKNGQRGYGQPEKRNPRFRMIPASSFCLKIHRPWSLSPWQAPFRHATLSGGRGPPTRLWNRHVWSPRRHPVTRALH